MASMHTCRPLVLTAVLAAASSVYAADWPQWRGPGGHGISPEDGVPIGWGPEATAWKTPLPGEGHSQPIVWKDRVFLTADVDAGPAPEGHKAPVHTINGETFVHPDSHGTDRRHALKVLALDLDSGRLLWERTAYEGAVFDNIHRRSSYAAPTMATDGVMVYAYFGPEGLYAYDFSGELRWKASVGQFRLLGMGTGSSPVLAGHLVIIQRDENLGEESFIVAFDKRTGKEAWRTARPVSASWSTPVLVEANGREELVTNGSEFVIAYDPATGKELWRAKSHDSNAIHTPLVGHGLVIVSAGYPTKRVIAIRPGGSGDVTGTDRIVWQYDRGTAYVPSPILYGDHVYLVSDNGILTCLDAKTGKVVYEGGRVPDPGRFMASPIGFAGTLLLVSTEGDGYAVRAGPVHEVLARTSIDEPVFSTPAVAHGRLLVRGAKHLYCFKQPG
jgi:outer membrane protein assembly factor BamB